MTLIHSFKRRRAGFTLAELLVAMAITAIILVLLVTVTGVALDGWRVSRDKVRASRQAKAALDQLARDFESMVIRSGNNYEWFTVESEGGVGPSGGGLGQSPTAAQLVFFTAATDRYNGDVTSGGGDVSTVSYELFYKNPITGSDEEDGAPVFALYRQLVNPDETFGLAPDYEGTLAQEDLDAAFDDFRASQGNSANFLCENIYEISLVFVLEFTTPIGTIPFRMAVLEADLLGAGSFGVSELTIRGNGIEAPGAPFDPASASVVAVEISLNVLSDSAMARLRNTSLSDTRKEEIIGANSFSFSKTVILPRP
jgi:prepilin-type N-terminal cleavage/methylation domain-containing protein